MSLRTDSINNLFRSFQRTGKIQAREKPSGGFSELFRLNGKNKAGEYYGAAA